MFVRFVVLSFDWPIDARVLMSHDVIEGRESVPPGGKGQFPLCGFTKFRLERMKLKGGGRSAWREVAVKLTTLGGTFVPGLIT